MSPNSPEELARQRVEAIAALEAQLQGHVADAQRLLMDGLLERLKELHEATPAELTTILPALLQEYAATVLVPLAAFYGQSLLALPGLNEDYFASLGLTNYRAVRAPLTDFLTARLGVDAAGNLVPGGYLATIAGDTTVARQVLDYAYAAQASGMGLDAYREGLNALVLGNGPGAANGLGVVQTLYKASGDDFARADRQLQVIAGKELGLTAYLYQGGLIESSRPFCVARNGKVFLDWEIARFGSKADAYGGYVRKAEGYFAGKPDPYEPWTDLGGHNCRHHLHAIPGNVAIRLRPELAENDKGGLYIK